MKAYILILVILGIVGCGKEKDADHGKSDEAHSKKTLEAIQSGKWCNPAGYCTVYEADGTWKAMDAGDVTFLDMPENTYAVKGGSLTMKVLSFCSPTYPQEDLSKCTFTYSACTMLDETHLDCDGYVRELKPL